MTSSTEKIKEKLRAKIKECRKKLSLTQLELGIQADVTEDYVHSLEAGRRTPSLDVLCRLADALKVEPYELLK